MSPPRESADRACYVRGVSTPKAAPLRELLAAGLVPRRLSGPDAAATLWCGHAIDSLAEGVRRERRPESPRPPVSATPADLERALLAVTNGPVLLDGTLAARALAGVRRVGGQRPEAVVVRWGVPSAGTAGVGAEPVLDAASLDIGSLFDVYLAAGDPPTVDGLELFLVEALVARAGLASAIWARGGDALFAVGDAARRACRRPRPRFLRRRFRPVADPLDVEDARRAEIAGLEGAPIHRVSAIRAVLPTQTRDALARFGPRAVPVTLPRDGHLPSTWAAPAYLGLAELETCTVRVHLPFAQAEIRALADALPRAVRFGRPGSGGALATWGEGPASDGSPAFDAFLDTAARGPLASRLDGAFALAARSPAFHGDAATEALRRFRAGTHGWNGRRVLTVALLASFVDRERLTLDGA